MKQRIADVRVPSLSSLGRPLVAFIALAIAACIEIEAAGAAGQQFVDSAGHVRIVGIDYARNGGNDAVVRIAIDPGYHINANPASEKDLIPTTLNITSETPLHILYPSPVKFTPQFAEAPIDVYQGNIEIIVERTGSGAASHLSGTLTVQACTDQICLPPADLPLPAN